MIRLEVLDGAERGRVHEADTRQLLIGRAPEADLRLEDAHLSAEHGLIFREQDRYIYRDLRSTNGSSLARGSERIALDGTGQREVLLQNGDELLLGDPSAPVILRCTIAAAAAPGPDHTVRVHATRALSELGRLTGEVARSSDLATLYRAVRLLDSQPQLSAVLEATAQATLALLPRATHIAILLEEGRPGEGRLVPACARTRGAEPATEVVATSRALLQRVLEQRSAVLAAHAADDLGRSESIMGAQIRSTLAAPLWRGEQLMGVIAADNRGGGGGGIFSERDLELLLLLGEPAALALENARLYEQLRLARERAEQENHYLRTREPRPTFEQMFGQSAALQQVLQQLTRVIDTRVTVCIGGETGTGKELVARAIHEQSRRRDKLFVAQNCAALPETLLESELFGHKKGAFTGAEQEKKGLFELADGGTLLLDEIGEMPAALQAKLLRVLQDGEVRPLGATRSRKVDARIVCATHRNLEEEVKSGRFRQDLYYRLVVFPVTLPPLRERGDDIPLLAERFLERYAAELRKPAPTISARALALLRAYRWPGNIRELENEMQRLAILVDDGACVEPEQLSPALQGGALLPTSELPTSGTLKEMMEHLERDLLVAALAAHGHNKTRTAATLGITREGLHKKLTRFGL
ncbi:MAG: sigma 54-interacting transcriptional regulator [Proteobacteria bacterium]|nr:sigma 54-interacting transcriptional regulator [Pseudomonadota bacterium]